MATDLKTIPPGPSGDAPRRPQNLWLALKVTIALVACAAAMLSLISLYQDSTDVIGYDFYESWVGGDVLRAGHLPGQAIDLYSDAAFKSLGRRYEDNAKSGSRRQRLAAPSHRGLYTASTPFFYWVFSIVTSGDYDKAFEVYRLIAMTCLVGSLAAVGWRLHYSVAGIGLAIALAAISEPVYSDFFVVNVNCPQLAACIAFLFLRDWNGWPWCHKLQTGLRAAPARPGSEVHATSSSLVWILRTMSGVLIGMLIAFKPNLLLFPMLLGLSGLVRGQYQKTAVDLLGLLLGLALAIAVSAYAFGSLGCWLGWAQMIQKLGRELSMPSGFGNISISRAIFEATGHNAFAILACFVTTCAVAAVWRGRQTTAADRDSATRDIEFRRDLAIFGLAETMTFMTSGLAWLHYPILLFPFVMLIAGPNLGRPFEWKRDVTRLGLAGLIIFLLLFPPVPSIQWHLPFRTSQSPLLLIRSTQAAIIVGFGLALWAVAGGLIAPRTPRMTSVI